MTEYKRKPEDIARDSNQHLHEFDTKLRIILEKAREKASKAREALTNERIIEIKKNLSDL